MTTSITSVEEVIERVKRAVDRSLWAPNHKPLRQQVMQNVKRELKDIHKVAPTQTLQDIIAEIEGKKRDPSYELKGAKAIYEQVRDAHNTALDQAIEIIKKRI